MMKKLYEILGITMLFINPWFILKNKDLVVEVASLDADVPREEMEKYFERIIDRAIIIRAVVLGVLGAVLLSNIVFMLRY